MGVLCLLRVDLSHRKGNKFNKKYSRSKRNKEVLRQATIK